MGAKNSLEKDWGNVWKIEKSVREINKSAGHYKKLQNILSKYSPGSKVLDAGSGLGKWVFDWQRQGYQAYGIDIVSDAIKRCQEYAKQNNLGCQFLKGDVRNMPFSDNFFEVIVSFGTIEHFQEVLVAVKEFYRTLKKGGTCFITTPNTYSFHGLIGLPILNLLKRPEIGYRGWETTYTPKELSKIMAGAGFDNIECGILPTGELLGSFYPLIPVVNEHIYSLSKKISYFIEKRQSIVGLESYACGVKLELNKYYE